MLSRIVQWLPIWAPWKMYELVMVHDAPICELGASTEWEMNECGPTAAARPISVDEATVDVLRPSAAVGASEPTHLDRSRSFPRYTRPRRAS